LCYTITPAMPIRCLVAVLAMLPTVCCSFEADVHFGLTQWLAIQAGFTPWQAEAIGLGDQRVDSGDMQYMELLPTYACLSSDRPSAEKVRLLHFPSDRDVPAPPGRRTVTAGSETARKEVLKLEKSPPDQAAFRLNLMGASLHILQDSWAHQGVPDVAQPFGPLGACDPNLAWSSPSERGGWNSHKADTTRVWPADMLAMAEATYSELQRMPDVLGVKRSAKPWSSFAAKLDGFIRASTKTEKQKWFLAQGIGDVSFLEGISLPDGTQRFELHWPGRKLPPLQTLQSTQHHIDPELLDAMSRFFTQWVVATDFDALAVQMAVAPAEKAELAARLRAWRIRDHGRVAALAHARQPLSSAQRAELSSLAHDPRQLATYADPTEAFFPLLVPGPEVSPLLGFILYPIPDLQSGNPGVIAVTKFRHAPYDTVEVLGERIDKAWRIVSIRAVVDH
jgi:hypothetical protein